MTEISPEEYRQAAQACRLAACFAETNAAAQPDPSAALAFQLHAAGLRQLALKLELKAGAGP